MRKLPEIYKEVVKINNNRNVFYSKNSEVINNKEQSYKLPDNSYLDILKDIFKLGKNSYTRKVRLITKDRVYETRLIRRNNGRLLTIDNDLISEKDIVSLEIL